MVNFRSIFKQNFFLYFLLISIFFLSCSPKDKSIAVLDYTIEKIDLKNNSMDVVFTITNSTSIDFKENEWSLHWNQILGEPLAESLPEGIDFERVNGNSYFIMKFGSPWPLGAGESISFRMVTKGVMNRLPLGPRGAFVVTSNQSIDLHTNIHWQEAEGLEELNLPTAKTRYQNLENINSLPIDSIAWIVPSPTYSTKPTKERLRLANWNVYIDRESAMDEFDVLLKVSLEEMVSTLFPDVGLQWVKSVEEANFILNLSSDLAQEGYHLEIKQDRVVVTTNSYGGLLYALQSLLQIDHIAILENQGWPIIKVVDEPRFTYRGFMLDISRNFYGLPKLKQIIDLMGMFKLNHFDIKLSDDEGWRLEIPGLPELTEIGSKRGYTTDESDRLIPMYGSGATGGETGNGFLSKDDFISLLQYAKSKNITIIPQLSFPSHARASIISMDARRNKLLALGDVVGAEKYALSDPNDKSEYQSAQLYNDNAINICMESSFTFFDKVVEEVAAMYREADVSFKQFGIGADELPYGVWEGSPICRNSVNGNSAGLDFERAYNSALLRLKESIEKHGAIMSGWEDFLLVHSKNSQSETKIKEERFNYEVIPYSWNNTWRGGREDMVYKLANAGFKTVMSNSSAFYFDMANDNDMDAFGLSWSGYVDYFDTWAIDPQDIFANTLLNQKHNIQTDYISKTTKLKPSKRDNLIGIQSQLWTETVTNDTILDQMLIPNLIVFAERAWAKQPDWISNTAPTQKQKMLKEWNHFLNVLGKRTLPILQYRFPKFIIDLPKPGGVIENDSLYVRSQFPGLQVHYSLDGSVPDHSSKIYQHPILIDFDDVVILRNFDTLLNGGKSIRVSQE
jgi:hexosaminidase